jgi:hypothetical protein
MSGNVCEESGTRWKDRGSLTYRCHADFPLRIREQLEHDGPYLAFDLQYQ